MRLVAYVRGAENDGHPSCTDKQYSAIEKFISRTNNELVTIYEDFGSGLTINRDSLLELLEDSKGNDFEMVIVNSLETLTRKESDLLYLIETLQNNRKKVFILDVGLELIVK